MSNAAQKNVLLLAEGDLYMKGRKATILNEVNGMKFLDSKKYGWLVRLINERLECAERLERLHAYLSNSRSVDECSEAMRQLMMEQERVMAKLLELLTNRVHIALDGLVNDRDFWNGLAADDVSVQCVNVEPDKI